jgi:hypothetical protein
MNKLVYSALAMTLCSVPGFASDNWSALDQELNSLSNSLTAQNTSGPKVGGWVISSFRFSDDEGLLGLGAGEELQGFQLDSVRLEVTGDAGSDYSYKVSFDLKTGTALIRDAYAKWKVAEHVNGKMGRYKAAFFQSGMISNNRLLFLERTGLGDVFDTRDLGIEFSGDFDTISWWVGAQNGQDGQADEWKYTARVRANLMGNGTGNVEGAFGSGDDTNLSAGIAWQDDTFVDDGTVIGFEVQLTAGPFSLAGEVADFDEGTAGVYGINNPVLNQWGIAGTDVADTTPWDVQGSYMITDMYEVGARYQDMDDDEDTTAWTVGINRYVQNHDIKWQLEWEHVDTDNASDDFDVLGLGLVVSI